MQLVLGEGPVLRTLGQVLELRMVLHMAQKLRGQPPTASSLSLLLAVPSTGPSGLWKKHISSVLWQPSLPSCGGGESHAWAPLHLVLMVLPVKQKIIEKTTNRPNTLKKFSIFN